MRRGEEEEEEEERKESVKDKDNGEGEVSLKSGRKLRLGLCILFLSGSLSPRVYHQTHTSNPRFPTKGLTNRDYSPSARAEINRVRNEKKITDVVRASCPSVPSV